MIVSLLPEKIHHYLSQAMMYKTFDYLIFVLL